MNKKDIQREYYKKLDEAQLLKFKLDEFKADEKKDKEKGLGFASGCVLALGLCYIQSLVIVAIIEKTFYYFVG